MINTIILCRNPYFLTPFEQWLPQIIKTTAIIVPKALAAQYGMFARCYAIEDYDNSSEVESTVIALAEQNPVKQLIAISEYDLLRAARLRTLFGWAGQDIASAEAYRNKCEMKRRIQAANIATAAYRQVDYLTDAVSFAKQNGYPIVLKPKDGLGSVNTRVIHSQSELLDNYGNGGKLDGFIAEQFIEGEMLHVDGYVEDDQLKLISVSQYWQGCLAFQQGKELGSYQIDPNSALFERVYAMTTAVIEAMPNPHSFAFHLELFHDKDDRLIFNEIASRIGGAGVKNAVMAATGIDLAKIWLCQMFGQPTAFEHMIKQTTGQLSGWLLFPKPIGVIEAITCGLEYDWIVEEHLLAKPGDSFSGGQTSVDCIGSYVISADNSEQLQHRLMQVIEQFYHQLKVAPLAEQPQKYNN